MVPERLIQLIKDFVYKGPYFTIGITAMLNNTI